MVGWNLPLVVSCPDALQPVCHVLGPHRSPLCGKGEGRRFQLAGLDPARCALEGGRRGRALGGAQIGCDPCVKRIELAGGISPSGSSMRLSLSAIVVPPLRIRWISFVFRQIRSQSGPREPFSLRLFQGVCTNRRTPAGNSDPASASSPPP